MQTRVDLGHDPTVSALSSDENGIHLAPDRASHSGLRTLIRYRGQCASNRTTSALGQQPGAKFCLRRVHEPPPGPAVGTGLRRASSSPRSTRRSRGPSRYARSDPSDTRRRIVLAEQAAYSAARSTVTSRLGGFLVSMANNPSVRDSPDLPPARFSRGARGLVATRYPEGLYLAGILPVARRVCHRHPGSAQERPPQAFRAGSNPHDADAWICECFGRSTWHPPDTT